MPPMPSVSPIVCRTPYRAGMSKSARVAAYPPTCTSLITYWAPSSAVRRSVVAVTVAPAPVCAEIRRASRSAWRQPLGADVVQREVQVTAELRVAAQVGHDVPGELDAARADERYLDHSSIVFH